MENIKEQQSQSLADKILLFSHKDVINSKLSNSVNCRILPTPLFSDTEEEQKVSLSSHDDPDIIEKAVQYLFSDQKEDNEKDATSVWVQKYNKALKILFSSHPMQKKRCKTFSYKLYSKLIFIFRKSFVREETFNKP